MIVFNEVVSDRLKINSPKNKVLKKEYFLLSPQKELVMKKLDYSASYIHLSNTKFNERFVIVLKTKESKQNNEENKAKT
jgi:hypothetical protein